MSGCATAACCSCGPIRARPRRWYSTRITAPSPSSKGACTRGIYDNMNTAVETVFLGKDRQFNRRFLRMCGHYLVEPTACTPASGWEKGQSLPSRKRGSRTRSGWCASVSSRRGCGSASYEELNAWVLDRCVAYAKAHKHPELTDRTIWQAFEAERPQLVQITGPFDGLHATQASVSRKTYLVRFDNNKYSVASRAVGRPVEIQAYADRVVIRQEGAIVGEHRRRFGRGETVYDPWHYVPVLAKKPGALRNGAPFKNWLLPASLERLRRKLQGSDDGDRQMVKVLSAVLTDGLAAVNSACANALADGVHSADVVLNILSRHRDPGPATTILTPTHCGCDTCQSPIALATTACGEFLMERTKILELMSRLKLYGMRAAGACPRAGVGRPGGRSDDHRHQAPARTAAHGWRSAQRRDRRKAGALDQISADHRQAAAGQEPARRRPGTSTTSTSPARRSTRRRSAIWRAAPFSPNSAMRC